MASPITGVVASQSDTTLKKPDIGRLRLLEPSATRFLAFSTRGRKKIRRIKNGKYEVQERRPRVTATAINKSGGYSSSDTELILDAVAHITVGDLLYAPATNQQMRVTAVDDGTYTVTVDRNVGSTPASLADDAVILRISRTEREGYTIGDSFVTGIDQVTNYAGIITTPIEFTNVETKEWSYASKDQMQSSMDDHREAMMIEHLKDVERHLLASVKYQGTSDGKTIRHTSGLIPSCVTYRNNHGGAADQTHTEFRADVVTPMFAASGGSEKVMFASNQSLSIIEGYGLGNNYYHPDEKAEHDLGFPVMSYRTSRGKISITHHPMFDEMTNYLDEAVFGYDPMYVGIAVFQDTKHNPNMQPRNRKTMLEEWETIIGTNIEFEECLVFNYNMAG